MILHVKNGSWKDDFAGEICGLENEMEWLWLKIKK